LARIYETLNQRLGRSLFETVLHEQVARPGASLSSRIAIGLAFAIHASTFFVAAVGIWLLIAGWPNAFALVLSGMLLGLAWLMRPRLGGPPDDVVDRATSPTLYCLVDRIADGLGADRVAGLVISPSFNAAIYDVGLRRERYIELGLPLLSILSSQERVALIAHELSHGVNGDPARGRLVDSAIRALMRWVAVLRPDDIYPSSVRVPNPVVALLMAPLNLALLAISEFLLWGARALIALLYRDSQRAEYYADLLASRLSGRDGMIGLLSKLYYAASVEWVVHRYANYRRESEDLFDNIRSYVGAIPGREIERLRRLSVLKASSVDDTHPPTAFRVQLIQERGPVEPALFIDSDESARLDGELQLFRERVSTALVQRHDEALWR